jgi:peptidoglycan/LPS O-acetylase OafA/YrhL
MQPRKLTQSGSTFLDCVRFGTALIVFLGHLALIIPATGRFAPWAHIAVCIFFVLSGFVIRMITKSRLGTMRDFLIDRASRIYSVVLPGLVVTVICEAISNRVNPQKYAELASAAPPFLWSHIPLQMLTNLTFTAQCWGYETNPLTNTPFWSLSFECVYYVLFALIAYGGARRVKWAWFALVFLAAGPSIALLFPTWLAGCLLYDLYAWLDTKRWAVECVTLIVALVGAAAWVFRRAIDDFMVSTDLPHRTAWLQQFFSPAMRHRLADYTGNVPWLSRFSTSFYVAAVLVFLVMLWWLVTIDRCLPRIPLVLSANLRWVAEGTFTLYLLHLPLLTLIACCFNGRPRAPWLWASAVVVFCVALSRALDSLKWAMRRWLRQLFPPGATARPA